MTATRTKRILSIQNVWDGGGSEKALIRMIRQLRADGWDCHVAIGGPPRLAAEYAAAGATVHVVAMQRITTSGGFGRWPRYLSAWPPSVLRLVLLARRLDVDVVHTNTLHSWYGWAVALIIRKPHVWHAREIVVQSALALAVERFLTRHFADQLVAISEAVAAQFRPTPPDSGAGRPTPPDSRAGRPTPADSRAGHPAPPDSEGGRPTPPDSRAGRPVPGGVARVVVVFDEPDPEEFNPGRAGRFRDRVGIGDDAPLVGSVGRIDTWKGVDVLLDAVPAIRAARPEVEILIAGPEVEGKEGYAHGLAQRAGRLGVRWLGPRQDVAELMADLDVFVMASTEPEPFGLGLVEALASGTPAVATRAGGPPEILSALPTAAGRLVPLNDATALADAVLGLLPAGASASAARAARLPLRQVASAPFGPLFDQVAARGRRWAKRPAGPAPNRRQRQRVTKRR